MGKNNILCIEECVKNAIITGNHKAFASFIIERAKFKEELFSEAIIKIEKEKGLSLKKCKILKAKKWRDWRVINTESDKHIHSESNKNKWVSGKSVPGRDEIVQIGIWFGLGCEEVNDLLITSGQKQLYALDIVDAIGMYYLEFYKNNNKVSSQEKIKEIKLELNTRLKLVESKLSNEKKKPLGYNDTGEDINSEIEKLISEYDINEDSDKIQDDTITFTQYVTKYTNDKLSEAMKEQDLDKFFDEVKDIVTQKQYGYLRRTLQFINNIDMYKKNLYFPGFVFTDKLNKSDIENMYDARYENAIIEGNKINKVIKNSGNKKQEISELKDKLMLLNAVWNLKNILPEYGTFKYLPKYSGHFKVTNLIQGREEKAADSFEYVDKGSSIYNMDNNNIEDLIKFAIICGREDEVGEYLVRSGHRRTSINDMLVFADEKERVWEKTDSLIIYVLLYRDTLIKLWAKQYEDEGNEKFFSLDAKKEFPVIQLFMTINKDIQEYLREKEKNNPHRSKEKYITKKNNVLIFPVRDE